MATIASVLVFAVVPMVATARLLKTLATAKLVEHARAKTVHALIVVAVTRRRNPAAATKRRNRAVQSS